MRREKMQAASLTKKVLAGVLFNRRDRAAANGPGARYLLGDSPDED